MLRARSPRRLAVWLTLVALLLATLAPGLSRALSYLQGQLAPWTLVCSAEAEGTPGGQAGEVQHLFEHCPFCSLQHQLPALPPAPAAPMPAAALRHAVPALFLHAPRPLHAWAAAQPRGPPTLLT